MISAIGLDKRTHPTPTNRGSVFSDGGPRYRERLGRLHLPSQSVSGWTVSYPIALPAGYETPTGLALDTSGGVWAFSQALVNGTPLESLFHWSANFTLLSSYAIDPTDADLQAGLQTPVVIDSSGTAWLGLNSTLVIAKPSQPTLTTVSLPSVTVGSSGSGLPTFPGPNPGAETPIDSLAVAPDGSIIVGRAFATELQEVNTSTLDVANIALPQGTALAGLGVGDVSRSMTNGDIAAALYSSSGVHELGQYMQGAWSVDGGSCPAYATSMSQQELVVTGPACVASASITQDSSAVTVQPLSLTGLTNLPCAAQISPTTLLVCVSGGVSALIGSSQSPTIQLGEAPTGPSIGGSPSGVKDGLVPVLPSLICSGEIGEAWFISRQAGGTIGLITQDT